MSGPDRIDFAHAASFVSDAFAALCSALEVAMAYDVMARAFVEHDERNDEHPNPDIAAAMSAFFAEVRELRIMLASIGTMTPPDVEQDDDDDADTVAFLFSWAGEDVEPPEPRNGATVFDTGDPNAEPIPCPVCGDPLDDDHDYGCKDAP